MESFNLFNDCQSNIDILGNSRLKHFDDGPDLFIVENLGKKIISIPHSVYFLHFNKIQKILYFFSVFYCWNLFGALLL